MEILAEKEKRDKSYSKYLVNGKLRPLCKFEIWASVL